MYSLPEHRFITEDTEEAMQNALSSYYEAYMLAAAFEKCRDQLFKAGVVDSEESFEAWVRCHPDRFGKGIGQHLARIIASN